MEQFTPQHPPVAGPAMPPHRKSRKRRIFKEVASTAAVLLLAPIAAIIFTAFVFQFYRVDGPSMEQTLQNNDRLIVYKLQKSLANLTNREYLPARGDVIVFNKSEEGGVSRQLIKRVIGMPGDRVVVKDGVVRIYNQENPNGIDPDAGTDHQPYTIPTTGEVDVVVGENEVFVLGDNRANSLDSRVFGTVGSDEIIGKLAMRVFPFKPLGN